MQNTMDTHGTGSDLLFRKVGIRTNSCSEGGDNGFLVLSLGPVDDSDVTYFNGVKIGATGTMPPEYASAYGVERQYRIPIDKVNWGESNVIVVEGASQGGGLSFATAALDGRIAFCAPDIPWLGDWVGYLAAAEWPNDHYPELIERFPGLTFSDINRVLSYVDTMNLADRIRCPVLMSVGLQDSVCPPRDSFATYNLVRSRKEYRFYPLSGHGVGHKHNDTKNEWIATVLGVKQP